MVGNDHGETGLARQKGRDAVEQAGASHENSLARLKLRDLDQFLIGYFSSTRLVDQVDRVGCIDDLDLASDVLRHVAQTDDEHTLH